MYKQGDIAFTTDGSGVVCATGKRVTRWDLHGSDGSSQTSAWEAAGPEISVVAVSPDGRLVFTADGVEGRAVLSTAGSQHVLGRLNLGGAVARAAFSPCSGRIAVVVGRLVQVWRLPGAQRKEWMAFELAATMAAAGAADTVSCLEWSPCGRYIATGSPDMVVRVLAVDGSAERAAEATGHRHTVMGVHWAADGRTLWTVGREGSLKAFAFSDGALGEMRAGQLRLSAAQEEAGSTGADARPWVTSVAWHRAGGLLLVGFVNGAFGLFRLDTGALAAGLAELVHALSLGQHRIDAVAINATGEWLAFGCGAAGQLLVWEWRSEAYVLKQQGHLAAATAAAFSADGQSLATGAQDGRIKVFAAHSAHAHTTFAEHGGAVTALAFVQGSRRAGPGRVLLSASTDGTVRAWDMVRGRCFRLLATPAPAQFSALAVDPAGDVVAAGTLDTFQIHLWSLQTGALLETLEGHTGPVVALAFDPAGRRLVSGSWDRSVRCWELFGRDRSPPEPLVHAHDVLAVAVRPDGREVCAATLGGELAFWDPEQGTQLGAVEARRDIAESRLDAARFTSVAYTVDGRAVLAAGNFPWIAAYAAEGPGRLLLKKLPLSTLPRSRDRQRITGAARTDDVARVVCVSPTGRTLALLGEQGCMLWGQDEGLLFDPVDLDTDCTPEAALRCARAGEHLRALLMALRLGLPDLALAVWLLVPAAVLPVLVPALPARHLPAVLQLLAAAAGGPHLELALRWLCALLQAHGLHIKACNRTATGLAAALRALHKACHRLQGELGRVANENLYALRLLTAGSAAC